MAKNGESEYERWHWGVKPTGRKVWKDPDYPEGDVIECGRLVEVHYREPGQRKDTILRLTREEANGSHLCYDPEHPNQRLYIFSAPAFRSRMTTGHLRNPKYQYKPLAELARVVGGRHGGKDYPNVEAMPLGVFTHVVYACEKKGDGYSFYIHKLGEETGKAPILALDAKGRMWVCGGNYTVPEPGITD